MAKWIVEAAPVLSAPGAVEIGAQSWAYSTDKLAKACARELAGKRCLIKVRSAPGIKPAVTMDHSEALIWAHD